MSDRASTHSPKRASTPTPPPCGQSGTRQPLERAVDLWLTDGRANGHSARTLGNRRHLMDKFFWWLANEEESALTLDALTPTRIRAFLTYLREERPEGRFGSDHPHVTRTVRPSTVDTYYRCLRAFVNWCKLEEMLDNAPLKNVKAPRVPKDQVQPFTGEQLQALLTAGRHSKNPERAVAIILVLLDTGLRVSEMCSLTVGSVDRLSGELTVTGKGNKRRQVYMDATTRRSLWNYLECERKNAAPTEPLFIGVGGHRRGETLTPSGVFRIIQAAGKKADVRGVRVSPHTLRHTFAVNFLRGGGNLFQLQELMGHTDLTVLRRYVALSGQDLATAHRAASPVARLGVR